jgi:hypothetical protein
MRINYEDMANPTNRANANTAIKARYTITENKNNWWRGYDRNYEIIWNTYGHIYNYMTISHKWGCLECIDEYGDGFIITIRNITSQGLDIVSAETIRNHNKTRRYTSEKYLKKYIRVAHMIFALVNCGYINTEAKTA